EGPSNTNTKEFSLIRAGTHIVNIAPMTYFLAFTVGLRLVFMINAIETCIQVILIMAPGNAGHNMNEITMLAPALNAFWQAGINSVNDRYIGTQIASRAPTLACLEARALKLLLGINWQRNILRAASSH